jgi:hypothetical protein
MIIPISVSQVARITGVSHQRLDQFLLLIILSLLLEVLFCNSILVISWLFSQLTRVMSKGDTWHKMP